MRKKRLSLLPVLVLAVILACSPGGTARAEKPVIDTVTITTSGLEAPVADCYPRDPGFTVSPPGVRVDKDGCGWLREEDGVFLPHRGLAVPGQYQFRFSLYADPGEAELADQVTVILDGKSSKVAPERDEAGVMYLRVCSPVCTAVTLPAVPGGVAPDPAGSLRAGQTVTGVLLDEAADLSPEGLTFQWLRRAPGSDEETACGEGGRSLFLDSDFTGSEIRLRVAAEGYSGYLCTDWMPVTAGASHTVSLTEGSADKYTARGGETVTVTAAARKRAVFDHWETLSGNADLSGKGSPASFVMPDGDVTLKPVYSYTGDYLNGCDVSLRLPSAGASPRAARAVTEGCKVFSTVWTDAETGAVLTDGDLFAEGAAYAVRVVVISTGLPVSPAVTGSFNGVGEGVAVSALGMAQLDLRAVFTASRANPFEDINGSDPWYDAVLWAYYAHPQVTNGMDATHFGPAQTVTRGQCVTFLWRAQGCPEPALTENPFSDVSDADYYYKAVLWAVENGITVGTDAARFSPDQTCSTAHIITFLYRALDLGADGWYEEAAAWADSEGLLQDLGLTVSPETNCPRGAVAAFLYRTK